jgi:phosphoglycolate phosphatase
VYAVLFDIDGTLVQTGGAGQLAFAETFAEEFGVPEISAAVKFAGRSDRAIAMDLLGVHGLATSDENWRRFRAAYVRRLPDALRRRNGHVLPGVVELLDALAALPHSAVGLLTGNIREGADRKLTHYGLGNRFAFGGFGDDTNDRCEIAAIALAEATRHATAVNGAAGTPPLRGAMVIGDTEHDIRCARAIGALAVAVPTGGSSREALAAESPDLLLDNLADARALIKILEQSVAA